MTVGTEVKTLSGLYAIIHIAKGIIEKNDRNSQLHRVTLIKLISRQNQKSVLRIFFPAGYLKLLATKRLWNISFNVAHVNRKIKNKHVIFNFLSFLSSSRYVMYFCCNSQTAHSNDLIFSEVLGKRETHLSTKGRTF